jgi:hypothetical protein
VCCLCRWSQRLDIAVGLVDFSGALVPVKCDAAANAVVQIFVLAPVAAVLELMCWRRFDGGQVSLVIG